MKKQLYIKNRHFKFPEVYSEQCSLCFYSLGTDSKQEVGPVFQEIFSVFKYVGTLHVFHIKCFSFLFTRISLESVNVQNINVDLINYNIHIYGLQ